MFCAFKPIFACLKKYKNNVFIKVFIVILGCLLLCFFCLAMDNKKFDRRNKTQRSSTEKLIQIKYNRPTKAAVLNNAIDSHDDSGDEGSGYYIHDADIPTFPAKLNIIPILPDHELGEHGYSDEEIDFTTDNKVSGALNAPAISNFVDNNDIEKLFVLSGELGTPTHLADIEAQPTNWLSANDVVAHNGNALGKLHFAITEAAASSSEAMRSQSEELLELHFKELFNDDFPSDSEQHMIISDEDQSSVNLDSSSLDDAVDHHDYMTKKETQEISDASTQDAVIYTHIDNSPNAVVDHNKAEFKKYTIPQQPNVPTLFDTLFGRMSPFFTPIPPMAPMPAYMGIRLPQHQLYQPRQLPSLNHLANFKDSPFKDDHLNLETTITKPIWKKPQFDQRLWNNLKNPTPPAFPISLRPDQQSLQKHFLRNWLT